MSIRHAKTSGIPNPSDATLVGGADWDEDHEVVAPLTVQHGTVRATRTSDGGTNAVITFSATADGAAGNLAQIIFDRVIAPNQPISVNVAGSVVTVFVATDVNSDPASTANQIIAAIAGNGPAAAVLSGANAVGSNGTGVHSMAGAGDLEGGIDAGDAIAVSAGGFTTTETLTVTPVFGALDGLRLDIPAGFDDNANARFRIVGPDSVDSFLIDNGGIDMRQSAGEGEIVIRVTEIDTGARTDISSRGLTVADSTGIRVFGAGETLGLALSKNAAPDDGDINGSEVTLWFDDTDGAAKLRIKGRSANGTIVTGSVNLT